jgi:hypothetical protein
MALINEKQGNIESILEKDGVYASVTSGVSMRPLFKTHRDMGILQSPKQRPEKYDVVLYRIGDKYILHRIVRVNEKLGVFIIRGDNTYRKEIVPFDKIIAVLTAVNRKGKRIEVTDIGYRMYSVFWTAIYPARYPIGKCRLLLGAIYRKLFKKNK